MDPIGAFVAEGKALAQALRDVPAADFDLITNCPPWTLAELVVHTAGSITMSEFADAPTDAVIKETAAYYRRPERDTTEYRDRNVRQTQQMARRVLDDRTATDCFEETLARTIAALAKADPQRVIAVDGVGAMRFGDWLTTRIIALTAHGLDVAITVGRRPWTTREAHAAMRSVFVSLLGADPREALGWDDQHFLATATGRAALTSDERRLLGALATRFPLLS